MQGWVPLTWWQVDVIGLLPSLEGYKYAITSVDTSTGLLAAYPEWHQDQKALIAVLEQLCAAYRRSLIIESAQGMRFTGALYNSGLRTCRLTGNFM